ncbi:PKD domain-containing protein [Deinococcus altitudinis]|uniref:PKD domain-containing protein n=1 Tax=Deinococcus altitudinis TaxID=468914 RepID=UPI003891A1D6
MEDTASVQFLTPPLAPGTATLSVPWYCPWGNFTLTYPVSFTVDPYAPMNGNTTDYAEANTPYVYSMRNTVKGVVYTVQWGDSTVDSWTGDGSPTHNFQHTYSSTGAQTYPLKSFGAIRFAGRYGGAHTETGATYPQNLIAVRPSVMLTSPANVAAGTDVTLAYSNLIPGKTYTVNWGDGTTQPIVGTSGPLTVTHQYRKDGVYQITTLGSVNLANSVPPTVTIKSPPPTLTVSGTGLTANLSVNGLQNDTQYTVDWGDNTTSVPAPNVAAQQLSHPYAAAGVYTVKLFGGAAVLATASYTATLGQVVLSVTPDKPVIGAAVTLNATGLAPSATYQLNWGDGTVEPNITDQSALNRTHSYASAQDFTVTIQSGGATLGTAVVAVQVPSPVLTPNVQGLTLTLQIDSLVAGAVYTLNWGDGPTEPLNASAPATTLTHTYTRPGSYTVVVQPARGQPSSRQVTLVAGASRLTITPPVVETDQTVTAAMADLIKTLIYTLDWKDGPPVTFTATDVVATQTHTYATPGSYQVDLTAPGTNPVSAPVTVRPAAPILQLSASDLKATLVATKLYTGVTYTLNWGGGATESFQATGPTMTFTHLYAAPGVQTVTVTPSGGTPATATVTLTVAAPTLSVTPAQGSTDTAFTAVLGQLVPTLTYTLNWGDGATEPVTGATTFTRTHQYAAPGSYSVSVRYADSAPVQQTVTVRVPAPVLNATASNLDATLRLSRLVQAATYRVQWGDGQEQPLTAQTPETALTHTYAAPGTYTLTVTPTLGDAGTTMLNVRYASVTAPTLIVTPVTASVYTEVRSDFSGLVLSLSYTLDWGDGQREVITGLTTGTRTHTYTTAGNYTVSLKATESPAAIVPITVTQPVAMLTVSSAGLQAQATLTGLVKALTYRLDWGDGTPAVEVTGAETQTLSHPYARPGEFRLTLSVPGGAPVTATVSVTVVPAVLTTTNEALTVTARVAGLQNGLTYQLAWGDGSSSVVSGGAADTLTHTYARPGVYTLILSTPGAANVTATVTLTVPAPTLVVTPAQGSTDTAFTAVLGQLVPTLTYTLNWGDGATEPVTGAATFTRTHQYAKPGTFTVTVTSPDAPPVSQPVTVRVPAPLLNATNTNLDVTLRLSRLVQGATYRVQWGDGQEQPLTAQTPETALTHTYAAPGTYTLTVTPTLGDAGTATLNVRYASVAAPTLTVTPVTASVYTEVRADFGAMTAALSYTLDWGDGQREVITGSTTGTRVHTYITAGTYTVSLKAPESPAVIVPVTVTQPVAMLTVTSAGLQAQATLTGLVKALTYRLDWGDGTPAVEVTGAETQTLSHPYARPGEYRLTLSVPSGAPVTATVSVTVVPAVLTTTNEALTVTARVAGLQNGLTYQLAWGDGSSSVVSGGAADTLTHTYARPGVYTLILSTPGAANVTATVTLTVPAPTLVVTPAQGSTDTAFTAVLGQLVPTLTYTLNWGDGATEPVTGAATFTRTHQYAAPGSYSVSVRYADSAPVQQTVTVRVPAPVLNATASNLDATLRLSRLVQAATYRVQWGDGQEQPLTAQTPETALTHTYAAPGTYTLTVTPTLGDAGTVILNVRYASVAAPTLTVTPVTASVYTEVRTDFGAMTAALSYTLDWGDGQREVITGLTTGTRVHTYITAGTYTVSLKAPESPAVIVPVTVTQPVAMLVVTSAGLQAQATLTGLVKALTYRLDWGDGTPAVEVTGAETQTLSHPYARPGDYRLTLSVPGGAPVTATVSVTVVAAVLTPVASALTVTATLSALQERLTYRLAWGDGSSTDTTGKAADTLTHTYARPGAYTLTLSTPGAASVTASVNLKANPPILTVVAPELRATATLSGLVSALTYTVNWGDGQQDTLTGQATATLFHLYVKPGQYTVTVTTPGTDPVTFALIVGLPPQEIITVAPALTPGTAPGTQEIRITGLLPNATYLLDYGDGQTEPLFFTGQSGLWTHRYTRTGVYIVTLLLRSADGVNSVRAVANLQSQQPLALNAVSVAFTRQPSSAALNLTDLSAVPLQLSVAYTGSGTLTGNWVLDGQAGPVITLDLPEQTGPVTATYTVSVPKPGRHTLSFQITALSPRCAAACPQPTILAANTVAYTLDSPSVLSYGGLSVRLTSVTNLDLKAFTGIGTVRLVVAGVDLGPQNVTLTNLTVTRTVSGATDPSYKVTGGSPTSVDLNNLPLRALSLGQAAVNLQTLTLSPDTAALSGAVGLPGATGAGLSFSGARLQDGGGFLAPLSSSGAGLQDLAIGTTGVSVTAASGVLDLSSTQNADTLGAAYARSASGVPGPGWMGVVLTGAKLTIGAPLISAPSATAPPVSISAPVAYTLGGYTTAFDLAATTLPYGGWSVQTTGLQVAVSADTVDSVSGKGSVTVPMVNEALPLNIGWNPQLGTPGAKWVFSAAGSPPVHDFGRTKLDLGTAAWETRGDGSAKLIFANAKWNLGGVSGAEVKLPLYNLTFTPDGGVNLGGQPWASATGLTNFTLFQYPFPAADVGVASQGGGQYTLSLRGKLQLTEAVPLSGTVEPVNFWVKDGKDVKIVFEKLQVKGEVKAVSFDVSVSAQFKDENNLEFIGEGDLTIAKKLGVGVKAGFGRDNGTGYGFLWAKYRAPDTSVKPLATVGAFGFYEFNGGLAINMSWKDGSFDAPPVKNISKSGITTVAVQAGTVFGPWIDKGSTAHFRGTLNIDTTGTVSIAAKAWFLTPLTEGAFGSETPNAAALVKLSVPLENPDAGYFLAQACVGPAVTTVSGLDCSKNRELSFAHIIALRGYAEVYTPFSGDGQHVYIGTKQNPIGIRLLALGTSAPSTPAPAAAGTTATAPSQPTKENGLEINGYLMFDSASIRAGFGANYRYSIGDKGEGAICNWHWEAQASVGINADFAVVYNPASLDASVSLNANASAGAGACGINVSVGVSLLLTGRLYVSEASRYFDGTFAGSVSLPVIPDISFSVKGRADF